MRMSAVGAVKRTTREAIQLAVGDEGDFRHRGEHPRDLAHDAEVVEHGVTGLHAGVGALVDEHLLAERIASGVEHLDSDAGAREALLHVEQRLQACRFLAKLRVALHGRPLRDELLLQPCFVVCELPLRTEVVTDEGERFAGQLHGALQRIENDADHLPDAFEVANARVSEHQRHREQAEKREPR